MFEVDREDLENGLDEFQANYVLSSIDKILRLNQYLIDLKNITPNSRTDKIRFGHSWAIINKLSEILEIPITSATKGIIQLCYNKKQRCQITNELGEQCNINKDHDCECHHFGMDSILYGFFPPSTCDIVNDEHDGSCSMCMVREVRDR